MRQFKTRFAAWVACCAILLATLAPSISHALAAGGKSGIWSEICSINGAKLVKLSGDNAPSSPAGKTDGMQHCPFCVTHGGSSDFIPTTSFSLPAVTPIAVFPSLFYQAPRPPFVWASAQSRAPPASV
ncbi:MAG: DUF2946 domain-containing protein [Burkholderiales bacterium]|nr:DUF2946 domain-containing protein [Burkholderiales bacterium]